MGWRGIGPAGHGRADASLDQPTPCSQSQVGHDRHLQRCEAAQVDAASALSVVVRWRPVMTAVNGTLEARPPRTVLVRLGGWAPARPQSEACLCGRRRGGDPRQPPLERALPARLYGSASTSHSCGNGPMLKFPAWKMMSGSSSSGPLKKSTILPTSAASGGPPPTTR